MLAIIIDQEVTETEAKFLACQAARIWLSNGSFECSFNRSPNLYIELADFDSYLRR